MYCTFFNSRFFLSSESNVLVSFALIFQYKIISFINKIPPNFFSDLILTYISYTGSNIHFRNHFLYSLLTILFFYKIVCQYHSLNMVYYIRMKYLYTFVFYFLLSLSYMIFLDIFINKILNIYFFKFNI